MILTNPHILVIDKQDDTIKSGRKVQKTTGNKKKKNSTETCTKKTEQNVKRKVLHFFYSLLLYFDVSLDINC